MSGGDDAAGALVASMEDALARDQRVALRPRPHMPAIGSIAEAKEDDSEEKDGSFGVRLNGAIDDARSSPGGGR